MNIGFADIRYRGNHSKHPQMDSSAVLMRHSLPSYTTVGHGQTSFTLDFRGSAMDSYSHGSSNRGVPRSSHVSTQDDACRLVLGLGPSPELGSAHHQHTGGAGKSKAPVTLFGRSFSVTDPGTLSLGLDHHQGDNAAGIVQQLSEAPTGNIISFSVVDEGSTSARRSSGGYLPSLLFAPRPNLCIAEEAQLEAQADLQLDHTDNAYGSTQRCLQLSPEPSATTVTEASFGVSSDAVTDATNPGQPAQRRFPKKCRFKGCSKGARGASGLCIAHGGGERCQKPGCHKGAESRTAYCKAHGGGRRCMQLGCTKSAEGKTDHCIAHGGGRRCGYHGCPKAARGKSGRCIKHGGGKRCAVEGCIRSAEGKVGLCISHGGGRRCQYPDCRKGAQGSTLYCKSHGGGKRCTFGTGCEKFARGRSGLCAAHATLVASQSQQQRQRGGGAAGKKNGVGGGSMIGPGLFHGIVSSSVANASAMNHEYSSSGVSTVSDYDGSPVATAKRHELIPPQVLVPLSMKSTSSSAPASDRRREGEGELAVPEGRVHGGGLLSLLGGSFRNVVDVDKL